MLLFCPFSGPFLCRIPAEVPWFFFLTVLLPAYSFVLFIDRVLELFQREAEDPQ